NTLGFLPNFCWFPLCGAQFLLIFYATQYMTMASRRRLSGQAFSVMLGKDSMMVKFEDIQSYGKEQFEQATANATAFQSGFTAIANAYGEHVKKQFEETKSFAEKLSGVKSLDKGLKAQSA